MEPKRIQRSRKKGSKLPPNTVCVTRPGRWGNPFEVYFEPITRVWMVSAGGISPIVSFESREVAARVAVTLFEGHVREILRRHNHDWLEPLKGKSLACWCPVGSPCHGDVLLELANKEK